ncbi:MAG: hypothetical protein WCL16_04455 [bacterium]
MKPPTFTRIAITADSQNPVLDFAVRELKWLLETATSSEIVCSPASAAVAADWTIRLTPAPELPPAAFEIQPCSTGSQGGVVELRGQNAAATLAAAYTFLERAGICFDVIGPVFPAKLDLELAAKPLHVVPAVIERGIRQHINFTMDISSYPLSEAREYIRNLARLRFNHITFHSYPGQWYEYRHAKGETLAGQFFYDVRHDVPAHPVVRDALRNRRVFCIPEIEPLFDRHPERSRAAIEWLRAVMSEARKAGMKVQFSLEIREEDPADGVNACESVLRDYPDIDVLELITPENEHKTVEYLTRYLEVLNRLRQRPGGTILQLAVGIYETHPDNLRPGLDFLRRACPADISWTFLPAHGSTTAVESMAELNLTAADWKRTRLYSWVEFDGLMYNQQNSLRGSKEAVDLALAGLAGGRMAGLDFNHWRTAENRAAIRYAAQVCIDPSVTPAAFCHDYGRALGVGRLPDFVKAMLELDETDIYCRDNLFNIGFCHLGCWSNPKGLSWTRICSNWTRGKIATASQRLEKSRLMFLECLTDTAQVAGRRQLRFLDNRIRCTQLHLQAVDALLVFREICDDDHPEALDVAGRALVRTQCDRALELAGDYMRLHAEMLPDRGAEGTLVSYYQTIPAYIRHIRAYFLGEKADATSLAVHIQLDAPPPPETIMRIAAGTAPVKDSPLENLHK